MRRLAAATIGGLLMLAAGASRAAEVKDSATAIKIAKSVCGNEYERWGARRYGDQWRAYLSADGKEPKCASLSVYVRARDGFPMGSKPDLIGACIICTH